MIDALRRELATFPGLRLAYLFGSRARGEAGPASDIDLAILGDEPLGPWARGAAAERLERLTGQSVDVIDLSQAPPLLAMEVVRDGQLLFARDPDQDLEFRLASVRRYQDTAQLRRVQHRYLSERAAAAGHGTAR